MQPRDLRYAPSWSHWLSHASGWSQPWSQAPADPPHQIKLVQAAFAALSFALAAKPFSLAAKAFAFATAVAFTAAAIAFAAASVG